MAKSVRSAFVLFVMTFALVGFAKPVAASPICPTCSENPMAAIAEKMMAAAPQAPRVPEGYMLVPIPPQAPQQPAQGVICGKLGPLEFEQRLSPDGQSLERVMVVTEWKDSELPGEKFVGIFGGDIKEGKRVIITVDKPDRDGIYRVRSIKMANKNCS